MQEVRPWGTFKVLLDLEKYKVKELVVHPQSKLSLQKHNLRSEYWAVTDGAGIAIVNDETIDIRVYDTVLVPKGAKHRIINPYDEPLVILEVQLGECIESDIERFEDDYGRV